MKASVSDWVIAFLGTLAAFLLSWPYWRDFGYWAESPGLWIVYFVLGAILGVYVFLAFIRALRLLLQHEGPEHHHRDDKAGDLP